MVRQIKENMEKDWQLPEKYWIYKKPYQLLQETRSLFNLLLIDYQICMKCIFRIYSFEHPKIYNDPEFYVEILPSLLQDHQRLNQYDPGQCCISDLCWLCQEVFQKSYSVRVAGEVNKQIAERGFSHYAQFKLNVRIPNIILFRNIILARYLYFQFKRKDTPPQVLEVYHNILVLPYENNKFIEPKLVLKWIIANELNYCTQMTSTADDHPENLVISIEQEHEDGLGESALMAKFRNCLGLEKKKEKVKGRKQCLDLGTEAPQDYRCNANNINKIVNLKQPQFESVLVQIQSAPQFWAFVNGHEESHPLKVSNISHKITLHTKNVYLCGRYIKFSRYLSQTPWMVNGKKLTEGSLQEQIEDKIYTLFYPGLNKEQIQTRFHAGGREDIDVRMLQGGRPFVLEFVNPIKPVKAIGEEEVMGLIPAAGRESIMKEFNCWAEGAKGTSKQEFHSWRVVKLLQLLINYQNQYVQVEELMETTQSYISVELKAAEMEKIKHYLCYIHSRQQLTNQDKNKLEAQKDLVLQQLTPLRVLHRRTLMVRDKLIHCLKMHQVSKHSAVLEVWASAGTYIKEFVHGDLGRTTPSVGSLIGKEVDILQLDVGSLKEGQWAEGDEHLMKLERLEWMK